MPPLINMSIHGKMTFSFLISSSMLFQIIGKQKLRRLAALAKKATISLCVDDTSNVRDVSEVATEAGVIIQCVVEVCVGTRSV